MSKEFVVTSTVVANGTEFAANRISITSGGGLSIDETIVAPATDQTVACVIDQSQLKAMIMLSDVGLEVHTNTLGGTDDITLVANQPLIWHNLMPGVACPITADITALHIVLGGSTNARFQAEFVYDPTV